MTQTARDAIDAALARWLDNEPAAYIPIRDDILAALAARGLVVEQDWQRIDWQQPETQLPEFPEKFLCMFPDRSQGVRNRYQSAGYGITHWRPLPAPPAAEAEAKETE